MAALFHIRTPENFGQQGAFRNISEDLGTAFKCVCMSHCQEEQEFKEVFYIYCRIKGCLRVMRSPLGCH